MTNDKLWAVVDTDNLVLRVESATEEWVQQWRLDNPDSVLRYMLTDIESRDYAGIGWSWDDTLQRFIPPKPDTPGNWVYDPDEWAWIDLDAPVTEGNVSEETAG